jgi:hypothetical protein
LRVKEFSRAEIVNNSPKHSTHTATGNPVSETATLGTGSSSGRPTIEVINSGLIECPGLKIASSGKLVFDAYQAEVQVLTLTNRQISGPAFDYYYQQIAKLVDAPLVPGNSEIVDDRGVQSKHIFQ